ncbi:MAG: dihydroorotase [Conexivisphaera sp.]
MGELLIRGGHLLTGQGVVEADVLVEDGRVAVVGRSLSAPGAEVLDATGMLVMPGAVDEHVHSREPGLTWKEDFSTMTRAAAAGGVTTVADMPNTSPPIDSAGRVAEKGREVAARAHVDYAVFAALTDSSAGDLEGIVRAGAIGLKAYMGPTTGGIGAPSDWSIVVALRFSRSTGVPIFFHAENGALVEGFSGELRRSGRSDPAAHSDARPPVAEEVEVARIARLAAAIGGRAHVAHLSSAGALEIVEGSGGALGAEVCPHHLLFTVEDYASRGLLIKVNPPVRTAEHKEALWRGIRSGAISTMGSDHAPHAPEEKEGDVWGAASGIPGVQTLLPFAFDAALRGLMRLEDVPRLLSENPARVLGLYPRKGSLAPGADADVAVLDPRGSWRVREGDLLYKHPEVSPYIGMEFRGRVAYTVLRGEVIYRDGELVGGAVGRWVTRGAGR